MEFTDVTGDTDAYYTSLDRAYTPPVQKKRKSSRTSEDAKIELWKSLAASLKSQDNIKAKSESFERATLFGKVGADSLLQYEPKKWCYLKKVMDVCYDYEQLKSNSHPIYQTNLSKRIISNQLILWTCLVMYQWINLLTCDASESIFSHDNFDKPK